MRALVRLLSILLASAALLALVMARSGTMPSATSAQRLVFGFAEADITPKIEGSTPVYLAGFGHNRRPTKVHDPIMLRAIVLGDGEKQVALVSMDVIGFFYPEVQAIRKELTDFHYVLVSSTHNHEGPDTLGLWGASMVQSGVDPEYVKMLRTKAVECVRAAAAAAKPAVARWGMAKAPELLRDSREPFILHDDLVTLRFVEVADPAKNLGILVQWNCHPETMSSENTELTADFPNWTTKALRDKHNCSVVYFTGTVGGLMTSLGVPIKNEIGEALKDGTWEKTERYGRLLAERGSQAIATDLPVVLTPLEVRSKTIYVNMTNPLYHLGRKLGVLERGVWEWSGDLYHARPGGPATTEADMAVETEVAALIFGDVRVACIPGEVYPELVLGKVQDPADPGADFPDAPIEPAIYQSLGGKHRMLIGLANDEIGYIIPKRQWDEKPPYCYGRKRAQYGEQNSVGPAAAPAITRAMKELIGDLK